MLEKKKKQQIQEQDFPSDLQAQLQELREQEQTLIQEIKLRKGLRTWQEQVFANLNLTPQQKIALWQYSYRYVIEPNLEK